jgi:hypothetical protein
MRRRGLTAEEILGALRVINARRCVPPLSDLELQTIATSVARYPPAPDAPPDAERTDMSPEAPGWRLHDASEHWDFPPVAELIDDLLPAKGIVWWGGLPKRYKSLFALYVALALACRRSEVGRDFSCAPSRRSSTSRARIAGVACKIAVTTS